MNDQNGSSLRPACEEQGYCHREGACVEVGRCLDAPAAPLETCTPDESGPCSCGGCVL
jgi:hypothetical protein